MDASRRQGRHQGSVTARTIIKPQVVIGQQLDFQHPRETRTIGRFSLDYDFRHRSPAVRQSRRRANPGFAFHGPRSIGRSTFRCIRSFGLRRQKRTGLLVRALP
jgi:hypothetical protein